MNPEHGFPPGKRGVGRKPKCQCLFQIYKQTKPRTLFIPLLGERERVAVSQGQVRQLGPQERGFQMEAKDAFTF